MISLFILLRCACLSNFRWKEIAKENHFTQHLLWLHYYHISDSHNNCMANKGGKWESLNSFPPFGFPTLWFSWVFFSILCTCTLLRYCKKNLDVPATESEATLKIIGRQFKRDWIWMGSLGCLIVMYGKASWKGIGKRDLTFLFSTWINKRDTIDFFLTPPEYNPLE